MDKYMLIRELGLQVFTKSLSSDTMVVSADELADRLDRCSKKVYTEKTLIELFIDNPPKSLEEKILSLVTDDKKSRFEIVEEIRKLVEKK